jgi:hypothetical protein
MSRDPGDYEVGYGKPPNETRFQKGRSGNPKGRPKGRRNWASEVLRVCSEIVAVRTASGPKRMTIYEALLRSETKRAINGDSRAFAAISKAYREAEQCAPGNVGHGPQGVLVVPGISSMEDWERMSAVHARDLAERQAKESENS